MTAAVGSRHGDSADCIVGGHIVAYYPDGHTVAACCLGGHTVAVWSPDGHIVACYPGVGYCIHHYFPKIGAYNR